MRFLNVTNLKILPMTILVALFSLDGNTFGVGQFLAQESMASAPIYHPPLDSNRELKDISTMPETYLPIDSFKVVIAKMKKGICPQVKMRTTGKVLFSFSEDLYELVLEKVHQARRNNQKLLFRFKYLGQTINNSDEFAEVFLFGALNDDQTWIVLLRHKAAKQTIHFTYLDQTFSWKFEDQERDKYMGLLSVLEEAKSSNRRVLINATAALSQIHQRFLPVGHLFKLAPQ